MKVLHVLDTSNWAGTESHVLTLARAQKTLGYASPTIACPVDSPLHRRSRAADIPCLAIMPGGRIVHTLNNGLRMRAKAGGFDLVHSHNGRSLLVGLMSRRPVVATQHFIRTASADRAGIKGIASRQLARRLGRMVTRWVAISDASRQAMLERDECDADKVDRVFNGVECQPPNRHTSEVRNSLALGLQEVFVLCVCRLEKEKNVSLLLDVVPQLPKHIRLIIAGDGGERNSLETRAQQSSLPIQFLGMRDDVPDLVAACDLFVLPAKEEPFGLVLIEAMSQGKPVVACAAGGPLEIVEHGVTGLLVPPSSPSAMADAMSTLAHDPELRLCMGQAGLKRYQALFTAEVMAQRVADVYRRVIDEWNSARK